MDAKSMSRTYMSADVSRDESVSRSQLSRASGTFILVGHALRNVVASEVHDPRVCCLAEAEGQGDGNGCRLDQKTSVGQWDSVRVHREPESKMGMRAADGQYGSLCRLCIVHVQERDVDVQPFEPVDYVTLFVDEHEVALVAYEGTLDLAEEVAHPSVLDASDCGLDEVGMGGSDGPGDVHIFLVVSDADRRCD